jgi:transposase
VYNKTVEAINRGASINFQSLRDAIVTRNTKKTNIEYKQLVGEIAKMRDIKRQLDSNDSGHSQLGQRINQMTVELRDKAKSMPSVRNVNVNDWEFLTPKEVRAGAVNDVCKAYKTGFANLRAGNIKFFKLGFRKHLNRTKSVLVPKTFLIVKDDCLRIAPQFFKDQCEFKIGRKTLKQHKQLAVDHDSRIIKKKNEYWIVIPVAVSIQSRATPVNYCGIDPGSRTFMTSFGNNGYKEYCHKQALLDRFNKKLALLKSYRTRPRLQHQRNRYRKRVLNKIEKQKSNIMDECHWKTINDVLKCNDVVFYGDIKSHDIVKKSANRNLNRSLNDLKLYTFKERLLYKASTSNKRVFVINEAYTTQTCSSCGHMYKPGCSEVYSCSGCSRRMGRDVNASKNILMKGIVTCL